MNTVLKKMMKVLSILLITVTFEGCYGNFTVGVPEQIDKIDYYAYKSPPCAKHGKCFWGGSQGGAKDIRLVGMDSTGGRYDKRVDIIESPTKETLTLAIKQNSHHGLVFELVESMVKSPSFRTMSQSDKDEIALYSIEKDSSTACMVVPYSKDFLIKKNASYINCLSRPSEELQAYVMKENPLNFQYINNPSESLQRKAIDANQNNIKYLKDSSFDLQMYIAKTYPKYYRYLPDSYVKPSLIAQVETTFTARPSTFSMKNKELKVLMEDGEIVFKNLTKKFLSIQSVSEYYGPTIYKIFADNDLSLPPESKVTWGRTRDVTMKASSMNDIVNYGFAVKYYVAGSQTQKNLYDTKDYTTSQLLEK